MVKWKFGGDMKYKVRVLEEIRKLEREYQSCDRYSIKIRNGEICLDMWPVYENEVYVDGEEVIEPRKKVYSLTYKLDEHYSWEEILNIYNVTDLIKIGILEVLKLDFNKENLKYMNLGSLLQDFYELKEAVLIDIKRVDDSHQMNRVEIITIIK